MLRRRIFHHLRLALILTVGLGLGLVVGGVYYLNQTGVNEHWRAQIAKELEDLGVVADFDRLTVSPTKGLIANGVRIYADDSRSEVVATLEHLVIDVDKTKLMRGKLRVNKVALKKANVSLPIDPDDPDAPRVVMEELSGGIYRPDKHTVEARNVTGRIAGIRVKINAHIWSSHLESKQQPKPITQTRVERIKLIARIVQEIKQWHWPEKNPPLLKLYLEGDMDDPDSMRLDFAFEADELESKGVTLRNIAIQGDYSNRVVTLDTFELEDGAGKVTARADYTPATRKGRFEARSSLHLQRLARKMLGKDIMQQLTFSTPPVIDCTGTIAFGEDFAPDVYVSGTASVTDFSCLGSRFKKLSTEFSTRHGDIFLTGLHATHARGELKGRILLKNETIRYEADSTLPVEAYIPFIRDSPIEKALRRAEFSDASRIHIKARGTMNRSDFTDWAADGSASLSNIGYMDVPLYQLSGTFSMTSLVSHYRDIRARFNYHDYVLRKTHGGPTSARVTVDSITVDRSADIVKLSGIRGTAWPAPIVRLFVPGTADHVEQYRFHRPPILRAGGQFDLRSGSNRTDFRIAVSNPGSMSYDFLGEPLTLRRLRANVKITDERVHVDNLAFRTFNGPCSGHLVVRISHPVHTRFSGGMQWRRLHLKEIGDLYGFDDADRGLLTGRMDFSGQDDNIRMFGGKGSISLEKGNLFSVPMLGPLSRLVGVVLKKRNPTEEKAKDASCTFNVRKGVLYSNDFLATTRSLKFTGEGSIDLGKKSIDMTMRMNARGLLGVFALPLRPFMGLFQFHGKGYVMDPKWRTTVFTRPARGKDDPIFRKPPKARVIGE